MSLLPLCCHVDDFWQGFQAREGGVQRLPGTGPGVRTPRWAPSEIMTILMRFHPSSYRTFKAYYIEYVRVHHRSEFPDRVSYHRFVELTPTALMPLWVCLQQRHGLAFVEPPSRWATTNGFRATKVFAGLAARGQTSMGWFYGFKVPLIVNDRGNILTCRLTPRRKNMQPRRLPREDQWRLRKRSTVETIHDPRKHISPIAHTRHRSVANFLVHLVCGVMAYCHQPPKPASRIADAPLRSLPQPV